MKEFSKFFVAYHLLNLYLMNGSELPSVGLPFAHQDVVGGALECLVELVAVLGALHIELLIIPKSVLMNETVLPIVGLVLTNRTKIVILCISEPNIMHAINL